MPDIDVNLNDELVLPVPNDPRENDIFSSLQEAHRDVAGTLKTLTAPPDEKVKASSTDATADYLDGKVTSPVAVVSDNLTIATASIDTVHLADDSIDKDKINADIAGSGLSQAAGGELDVNVDDSTLEINTDTLRIKDSGVTKAKIEDLSDYTVLGNVSGGAAAPAEVAIKDEDDMTSDSATSLASQQSIKKYVDDSVPSVAYSLLHYNTFSVSANSLFTVTETLTSEENYQLFVSGKGGNSHLYLEFNADTTTSKYTSQAIGESLNSTSRSDVNYRNPSSTFAGIPLVDVTVSYLGGVNRFWTTVDFVYDGTYTWVTAYTRADNFTTPLMVRATAVGKFTGQMTSVKLKQSATNAISGEYYFYQRQTS